MKKASLFIVLALFACEVFEEPEKTIDNEKPTISIVNDINNPIVSGDIDIECIGDDNDEVLAIKLTVGSSTIVKWDSIPPFIFEINTKNYENGTSLLFQANAIDKSNNMSLTDSLTIIPYNPKIVFLSERFGNTNIFMMDYDGENPTQLTDGGYDTDPVISPDGSQILYLSIADYYGDVWLMNVDGSNKTNLTFSYGHGCHGLSFSPDGSKVIYISNKSTINSSNLYIMDLATGVEEFLSENAHYSDGEKPTFTPDGENIIFTKSFYNSSHDIYSVNIYTKDITKITTDSGYDYFYDISNDGNTILFSSSRSGEQDLFSMNIDGTNIIQITSGYSCTNAKFSPDNSFIVFGAYTRQPLEFNLYKVNLDGSQQTVIYNNYLTEFSVTHNHIIGTGYIDGDLEILKINIHNSEMTNLSSIENRDSAPFIENILINEF